mmetsp:Transcript_1272/g.4164  ORF Transcript_1272/g.4164 Transcript_1272/m.4164 type:complete len:209 (+) Transcript_1272:6464-7090(+)
MPRGLLAGRLGLLDLLQTLLRPEIQQTPRLATLLDVHLGPLCALLQRLHHKYPSLASLPNRRTGEAQRERQERVCHREVPLSELPLRLWVVQIGPHKHLLTRHQVHITQVRADLKLFPLVLLQPLLHVPANDPVLQLHVHAERLAREQRQERLPDQLMLRTVVKRHIVLPKNVLRRRVQHHQHLLRIVHHHQLTALDRVRDKHDELAE